jgi:hypothetical protein
MEGTEKKKTHLKETSQHHPNKLRTLRLAGTLRLTILHSRIAISCASVHKTMKTGHKLKSSLFEITFDSCFFLTPHSPRGIRHAMALLIHSVALIDLIIFLQCSSNDNNR